MCVIFQGQFRDPAGLVSDSIGNVILADAGNHRLQVFDKSRKFVGNVHIYKGKIFRSGPKKCGFPLSMLIFGKRSCF